jgi:hypothetical protein
MIGCEARLSASLASSFGLWISFSCEADAPVRSDAGVRCDIGTSFFEPGSGIRRGPNAGASLSVAVAGGDGKHSEVSRR